MPESTATEFPEMEKILVKIISSQTLHCQWLNLLSYLEFTGSRKIFKTQQNRYIGESVLKHASDEARHALLLKQMLGRIQSDEHYRFYDYKHMICPFSGYRYMQSLDSMVKRRLQESADYAPEFNYLCYIYVSFVIEVRANWLYDIYARLLTEAGLEIKLDGIINDEIRHLDQMKKEIDVLDKDQDTNIRFFLAREKILFERFLLNLQKAIVRK